MLINLSNHPSSKWGDAQQSAGLSFGELVDLPFPDVNPLASGEDISSLADELVSEILNIASGKPVTVHVMGEMTLIYAIVRRLKSIGIKCVASATERIIEELPGGVKKSVFVFRGFREYID